MQLNYDSQLRTVCEVQGKIRDLHPFLEKLFPIAIAEEGQFYIYAPDPAGEQFHFAMQADTPMPIPRGIRAAFPLECFANRAACVVSGEVFDSLEGYITIFHEFMHCLQFESCEQALKNRLEIARKAQAANDYLWELNHPFPYTAPEFIRLYGLFLDSLCAQDLAAALDARRQLNQQLPVEDQEYMLWQEWKEGFARYIENRVRCRLHQPENHNGQDQPFSRVSFYAGGAGWITLLGRHDPGVVLDLELLFKRMGDSD